MTVSLETSQRESRSVDKLSPFADWKKLVEKWALWSPRHRGAVSASMLGMVLIIWIAKSIINDYHQAISSGALGVAGRQLSFHEAKV